MANIKLLPEEMEYLKNKHRIERNDKSIEVTFYNVLNTFPFLLEPYIPSQKSQFKRYPMYKCNFHFEKIVEMDGLEHNLKKYLVGDLNHTYNNLYIMSLIYSIYRKLKFDMIGKQKIKDGDLQDLERYPLYKNTFYIIGTSKFSGEGKDKMFEVFNINNINISSTNYIKNRVSGDSGGGIKTGDLLNVRLLFRLDYNSEVRVNYMNIFLKNIRVIHESKDTFEKKRLTEEEKKEQLVNNFDEKIKDTKFYKDRIKLLESERALDTDSRKQIEIEKPSNSEEYEGDGDIDNWDGF